MANLQLQTFLSHRMLRSSINVMALGSIFDFKILTVFFDLAMNGSGSHGLSALANHQCTSNNSILECIY